MKGAHRIIVETRKIKYDFTIKRNITILTGNSGSGKTVLIDLIREYRRYGSDSGVSVSCDRDCRTLDTEDWQRQMEEISESIIFIDEGNRFLVSKIFAELVQKSDNYFVIATREKLPMLPYSVNEIYGFRKSGKFQEAKQKYNEIYHLYGEVSEMEGVDPKLVITEDSNSGYEFFSELARQKKIDCISANVIPNRNTMQMIQQPEKYIDSKEYASWEQYFTKLLVDKTKGDIVWSYSKRRLSKAYLSAKVLGAAKRIMKLIIWD